MTGRFRSKSGVIAPSSSGRRRTRAENALKSLSEQDKRALARLQRVIEARVGSLVEAAALRFDVPVRMPEIRFDLRGQSAGQARIDAAGKGMIRFNPWLLLRHSQDFIEQTVPHETAHWLVFCLFGTKARPHGPEWRHLMEMFGADPQRCHNYDLEGVPRRQVSEYPYFCDCMDHRLSAIRHNRARKGQRYLCRRCGTALRPRPQRRQSPGNTD